MWREGQRTHDTGDGKLPVVKGEVHYRLCIAAFTATTAVCSEAVKHAFGHVVARRGHLRG